MSGAGVVYRLRADAAPEVELRTLVASYHFILFKSDAIKEAVRPGGPSTTRFVERTGG
jgi:hypothetical protein